MSLTKLFKDRKNFTDRYMIEYDEYGEGCYPPWVYYEYIQNEKNWEIFRGYEAETIELTICCQEFRHGMELMNYFNYYDPALASIWIDQYNEEIFDQELFDFYIKFIPDSRLIEEYNYIKNGSVEIMDPEYVNAFDKLFSKIHKWY